MGAERANEGTDLLEVGPVFERIKKTISPTSSSNVDEGPRRTMPVEPFADLRGNVGKQERLGHGLL